MRLGFHNSTILSPETIMFPCILEREERKRRRGREIEEGNKVLCTQDTYKAGRLYLWTNHISIWVDKWNDNELYSVKNTGNL